MKVVLVGNQNCGKSSLFNLLCDGQQKIGNWAGVTIEKKEGEIIDTHTSLIDLPGTYSLNPFTEEEKITCQYLKNENYDCILNIVDSMNLRRSLYLTLHLLKLNKPILIVFNMWDEVKKSRSVIQIEKLKRRLNVEMISISTKEKTNIEQLKELLKEETLLNAHPVELNVNCIEETYAFIDQIIKESADIHRWKKTTDQIDQIVLNKYIAIPLFICIMGFIYFLSVGFMGKYVSELMSNGLQYLLEMLKSLFVYHDVSSFLSSLVCDGLFKGVLTVLTFIPQLFILFFCLGILETSGYMSRITMIFEKIFSKIGLSGKTLIPFIIGSGCSVPAIMSCKTIENERKKKLTIFLTPFVPCSAKLPMIILFSSYFFPYHSTLVAISLYFLSAFIIVFSAFLIQKFLPSKEKDTYLFDLPPYRCPSLKYLIADSFEKVSSFIKKAGSIIFIASLLLWLLLSFDCSFQYGCQIEDSMLAWIGKKISFLFYPILGTHSWIATVSAIQGLIAKEQVIASLSIIASKDATSMELFSSSYLSFFNTANAYSYMIFCLFSAPCMGAISAMKKELNSKKWTLLAVFIQTGIAYFLASTLYYFVNLVC